MNHIKHLTHEELLRKTKEKALEERRIGIELLHYLREIERRRLFVHSHSSLHEYVVRELGYSDGAAHRRISAMRLMREIPEVESKLSTGSLSLSTASQLQNFLVTERRSSGISYSVAEKQALVTSIEHKSTRQTEALLAARSPRTAALLRERPRSVDGENLQVTVVLTKGLQSKLERLKNLMSHRNPNPSLAEQLEMLADLALRRLDPEASAETRRSVTHKSPRTGAGSTSATPTPTESPSSTRAGPGPRTRFIPLSVRRQVWNRAANLCEHRSPTTGARCSRRHLLQIDHRLPFSRGGTNALENLQLLCATHNQWKGVQVFSEVGPGPTREPKN